ncbi:hypothetical protein [Paraburkholderia guartelaensis]|uniref:hypothetical protein n=1 Tax=Paraburkholderia guartelaensis TaxID=2546446 RepID=UPI002AB75395|nr:hypothetical protein [Paraburkholderia guartelaensis]
MLKQDNRMPTLGRFTRRTHLRNPDDSGTRLDRRRARLQCMRAIGIAGALVACVAVASGWAVVGLAAYVASLAPLIILSW